MVALTPLSLHLQDLTLPAPRRTCAARVGKLKGWCAPEFEFEVCATALVDVDLADLAAGQAHGGDGVDGLGELETRETFGGGVAQASDDEGTRELGEAAEVCARAGGFAHLAFESVVHFERLLSTERV